MSARPLHDWMVRELSNHPTEPIPAYDWHSGGGIWCVRVDVDSISDIGPHDGPYLLMTDGADFSQPGTIAVGLYPSPEYGEELPWPDGEPIRCAPVAGLHETVSEGADILHRYVTQ